MRYTRFFLIALVILAITALVACGGGSDDPGGSGSTSTSQSSQVTPAQPSTAGSQASSTITSSTPSQASSSPQASTGASTSAPGSTPTGASSSGPAATAPVPTSPLEPTAVPARVVAPGLVNSRPCLDEFGDMLVGYDGPERFDAALVTSLSEEFGALHPRCISQGWDPEFAQEPYVCNRREDLPGAIMGGTPRDPSKFIGPTMWRIIESNMGDGITHIRINVHLARVPVTSIPSSMQASSDGSVGGCWTYGGVIGSDGEMAGGWNRSYFKYRIQGDLVLTNVAFPSDGKSNVLGVSSLSSHPECDTLLQAVLSEELEAGRPVGLAGVDELVLQVRAARGAACGEVLSALRMWQPSPVEGPSLACPAGSPTGLEADGFFVVNWSEDHHDLYGSSACWVRSPEGEWGAYLISEGGPSRPAARVVEAPPEADRETLVALYRALGGNRWDSSFNEFWMTDFPIDRWKGIRVVDGRVIRLNLAGAGLRGEIPAEIGELTVLEELDLGDNRLTGEIPPEIGVLTNLKELDVGDNRLTGEVPPDLWGLSNLVELRLNGNELTGEVPAGMANLTKLKILAVAGTGLTGCVPAAMRDQLGWVDGGIGLPFCH